MEQNFRSTDMKGDYEFTSKRYWKTPGRYLDGIAGPHSWVLQDYGQTDISICQKSITELNIDLNMKPTIYSWILAIFGAITFLPLLVAQIIMLLKPDSQQARDLIIGKGKEWRDHTHFRSGLALAWVDILLILPLLVLSYIGVFTGQLWGYGLFNLPQNEKANTLIPEETQ